MYVLKYKYPINQIMSTFKTLANIVKDKLINMPENMDDKEIVNYVKNHLNCLRYRVHNNPLNLWHKIKLFDYMYFSKTKKGLSNGKAFCKSVCSV